MGLCKAASPGIWREPAALASVIGMCFWGSAQSSAGGCCAENSAEWEIEADELELGPRIGIGSFGEVFRGTWRHTDVAVKRFLEQDLSPQVMAVRSLSVARSGCLVRAAPPVFSCLPS